MPKVLDFYQNINELAPFETAMEWDNVGLMVGDFEKDVTGCLLALDVTNAAIDEAVKQHANLIVTHHPVIFHPVRSIRGTDVLSRLICEKISVISAHTNLDLAKGGVNDALADTLGLFNVRDFPNADHLGRIGTLPCKMSVPEFAEYAKKKLHAPAVLFTPSSLPVSEIAVVSGAGGEYIQDASIKADLLLTGEAKQHELVAAINMGFSLVAAGHYATEAVVLEPLCKRLKTAFSGVETTVFDTFPTFAAE